MSILPSCTCERESLFEFSESCPRHASSAKWWKGKQEERAARLAAQREQALTRPVHGGYPDASPRRAAASRGD